MIGWSWPIRIPLIILLTLGPGLWCCCVSAQAAVEQDRTSQPQPAACAGKSGCHAANTAAAAALPQPDAPPAPPQPSRGDCGCAHLTTAPEQDLSHKLTGAVQPNLLPPLERSLDLVIADSHLAGIPTFKPPDPPGVAEVLALHCQFLN